MASCISLVVRKFFKKCYWKRGKIFKLSIFHVASKVLCSYRPTKTRFSFRGTTDLPSESARATKPSPTHILKFRDPHMAEQVYDCRDGRWDHESDWFVPSDISPHWQWWSMQKNWRLAPVYVSFIHFKCLSFLFNTFIGIIRYQAVRVPDLFTLSTV